MQIKKKLRYRLIKVPVWLLRCYNYIAVRIFGATEIYFISSSIQGQPWSFELWRETLEFCDPSTPYSMTKYGKTFKIVWAGEYITHRILRRQQRKRDRSA